MTVFVCGALHLDVIVRARTLPRPDETAVGQSVSYAFGGKGGNQAVAAARMGARTAIAGCIGNDAFGTQLRDTLIAAGVDTAQIRQIDGASGMSVAIVDASGTYGAVIVSAANLHIPPPTTPPGTRFTLLQNEIPEAINLAAARAAQHAGARTILNAAPARAPNPELLALTDILVVNRVEAADLLGTPLGNPRAAARALAALGPKTVLLTLGGDGLILQERGETRHFPAHKVEVISTHGAGDAFVGAFTACLAAGDTIAAACDFARAAAALHVSTPPEERAAITPAMVQALTAT